MKALLLAAGSGQRLLPLSSFIPKPLAPINGYPLLGYWVDLLFRNGVDEVFINISHHANMIEKYFKDHPQSKKIRFLEEKTIKGTGKTFVELLQKLPKEDVVLVAHADNLSVFNLKNFVSRFYRENKQCCMMTFLTQDPSSCGIIELDSCGNIQGYEEKPKKPLSDLANGAVYLFSTNLALDLCEGCEVEKYNDLSVDIIPKLVKSGEVSTFFNDNVHIDIGTPPSLRRAQNIIDWDEFAHVRTLRSMLSKEQAESVNKVLKDFGIDQI